MLCCCCPAWIWTLGCCWMTAGGVLATAAVEAMVVATGLALAGIPGCWALITAVKPVSFAGVLGAEWVARIYCGCCCRGWPALALPAPTPPLPVELVFSKRLANACGGLEIGFKMEGLDGLFFCLHSSQAATSGSFLSPFCSSWL